MTTREVGVAKKEDSVSDGLDVKPKKANRNTLSLVLLLGVSVSIVGNVYLASSVKTMQQKNNELQEDKDSLSQRINTVTSEKEQLQLEIEKVSNVEPVEELLPPTKEDWGDWEPVMAPGTHMENGMVYDEEGNNWGAKPGFNPNAKEIPGTRGAKNVYVPAMGTSGDLKPDEWLGDDGWVHWDNDPDAFHMTDDEMEANARELERLAGVTG